MNDINQRPVPRLELINLIQTSLNADKYRFGRHLASHWLTEYPGDLLVETLLAQAMIQDERSDLAIPILKRITHTDPESLPAHRLLGIASRQAPYAAMHIIQANIFALGGKGIKPSDVPDWGPLLLKARQTKEPEKAESFIHQALVMEPEGPLAAVLHLKLAIRRHDWPKVRNLSERYSKRWPDSIVCLLVWADVLMKGGQEEKAVELLHQAVTMDTAGQIASRLWGRENPYLGLWPKDLTTQIDFQLPAAVSAALGWNKLPQGELAPAGKSIVNDAPRPAKQAGDATADPAAKSAIKSIQNEFTRIAAKLNLPEHARADARFPIYVLLTTREGLESQYGAESLLEFDQAMQDVVKACRTDHRWDANLIYADDAESLDKYGIPPAKWKDPWSIKNLLIDLDAAMAKRGERIGALLIVGGPKVVPFHRLPNPIDDIDNDVLSDNPYATTDENYFVPSWPTGRLPGDAGSDPAPLLTQLGSVAEHRGHKPSRASGLRRFLSRLIPAFLRGGRTVPSFGYTAQVWRRASNSVFRPIGKPHTLVISPPTEAEYLPKEQQKPTKLAYFNLHGLEDTADWYGQRDPIETPDGPDYPVALRPENIVNSGRAPQLVFSEACYGANIIKKHVEDAICLKFLTSGTLAVIGSTCTSYGSISTPLIAADMLGKSFWNFLQEGYPAGEALRRAKLTLIREMHKRQGYLDGEDQKTLIQFVLYGDPLAQPHVHGNQAKHVLRIPENAANVKMVCDKSNGETINLADVPKETVAQVKGIVKEYLPGMSGAKVTISREHAHCDGHNCPTHQIGAKAVPKNMPRRQVVTLSKTVENGRHSHPQFARITFDAAGKMVKLVVSR